MGRHGEWATLAAKLRFIIAHSEALETVTTKRHALKVRFNGSPRQFSKRFQPRSIMSRAFSARPLLYRFLGLRPLGYYEPQLRC